jgi:hypothetical protein
MAGCWDLNCLLLPASCRSTACWAWQHCLLLLLLLLLRDSCACMGS